MNDDLIFLHICQNNADFYFLSYTEYRHLGTIQFKLVKFDLTKCRINSPSLKFGITSNILYLFLFLIAMY